MKKIENKSDSREIFILFMRVFAKSIISLILSYLVSLIFTHGFHVTTNMGLPILFGWIVGTAMSFLYEVSQ